MSNPGTGGLGTDAARPGREALVWSGVDGHPRRGAEGRGHGAEGRRRGRGQLPARDHPGDSYYGKPIINPPTWAELDIAGYLFAGGLAGSSSILAAGAELTGRPVLAQRSRLCASAAISVSLLALIHDLGRPARFLHMLRVFKPSSPMSVGVWLLFFYGPLAAGTAVSDVLDITPRTRRAAGVAAAALGAPVTSYTAALIADTAVPAWHEAHRELPFVFVSSAATAGAGFGLLAAPLSENEPARRLAVLGSVCELIAEQLMERRLGMVAEALHSAPAGSRLRAAKALTAVGALGAATLAGRSRAGAALAGASLLAGSALTRFGIFAAGMESARDPKYTVEPQRERLRHQAAGA